MKYIKSFSKINEARITDKNDALRWLSQIYKIEDEVQFGEWLSDYLVPVDDFLKLAKEHDGSFAGNFFDTIEHFEEMINYIKSDITDKIYVAPYWLSRDVEDIIEFGDVYADTLYILDNGKVKKSDLYDYSPDEFFKMSSKYKNKNYIRLWWD